jgi:uncharacterized UBP type Zn finger protein
LNDKGYYTANDPSTESPGKGAIVAQTYRGISNLGSTFYLSSLLQLLSHSEYFDELIEERTSAESLES